MAIKTTDVDFAAVKKKCQDLESLYAARNTKANEMEAAYFMDWTNKPLGDEAKVITSPSARNKANGAIWLMTATDPVFSVPFDLNDDDAKTKSEAMEKMAAAMWHTAGLIRQRPVHYDAVTSGVLFGEMHIGVVNTKDLSEQSKGGPTEGRFSKIAEMTPFIYEVYDPRTGYPEYDALGLSAYYRKVKMKTGEILDRWGDLAIQSGMNPGERFVDVNFCDYWDNVVHIAWIEGKTPLYIGEHGLPCIPIVAQIVTGSTVFESPEDKIQPFLQTVVSSGVWESENISLTSMATYAARLGTPTFVYQSIDGERELRMDKSVIGGVANIRSNESVMPLVQKVIDDSISQLYTVAKDISEQSTIYGQTMGQPISSTASFSATSLLHQAGRLPLITIQKLGGWAIARALEISFEIMRDVTGAGKAMKASGGTAKLKPSDIPKAFIIDARLEIDLPQDKRNDAMILQQLTSGDNPAVSMRWAREEILNIGQSKEMSQEIVDEKLQQLEFQKVVQIEMARTQAAIQAEIAKIQQQSMGQQMPGQQPGQQPMPQQPPPQQMPPDQGIPPELMAQLQAQQQQGQPPDGNTGSGMGMPGIPLGGPMTPDQMGRGQ